MNTCCLVHPLIKWINGVKFVQVTECIIIFLAECEMKECTIGLEP